MEIYGCAGTEDVDRVGERVLIDGMDISSIRLFNDEHESSTMFQILGNIDEAKKIMSEKDISDEYQEKCWKRVGGRPFLYVRGRLADDDGHPNAQAAASLIKFGAQNSDFKVGLSVEGSTVDKKGKDLVKTKVNNVSLTVKPANPNTFILPLNDLAKSDAQIALPEKYKNVEGRKQFRNLPDVDNRMLAKSQFIEELSSLMKSDKETQNSAVVVNCWNCGEHKLFMKMRLPNRCLACGEAFSMSDLFRATQSEPII